MKALVGTFNQEKALVVGDFSVIVKYSCDCPAHAHTGCPAHLSMAEGVVVETQ